MKKFITASITAAFLGLSMTPALAADPSTKSGSAGQYVDDATVTTKVKAALAQDDLTKARNIKVETTKGVVVLSGAVDSRTEREQATSVARSIEGVADVQNKLTTK